MTKIVIVTKFDNIIIKGADENKVWNRVSQIRDALDATGEYYLLYKVKRFKWERIHTIRDLELGV